jgi:hypothetical protein
LKIPNTKQGWWSNSSVEHLHSKCEVLSSKPSTEKKERKKKKGRKKKERVVTVSPYRAPTWRQNEIVTAKSCPPGPC